MRKIKITLLLVAMTSVLLMLGGGLPVSAASESIEIPVTYKQTDARSMLSMINEFRTGSDAWYWNSDNTTKTTCSGLSELTYDYDLEKVAMQRAAEIALSFSHTRPDGTTCWTAYSEDNYSYSACAENIACGYSSASSVFKAWQETNYAYEGQGHRRNMLGSSYNVCAVACVYYNGTYFWVQEFARTSKSSTKTTANDSATTVSANISSDMVYSLSLTPSSSSISLIEGKSTGQPTLTAKILFIDGVSYFTTNVSCTWNSGDTNVATVSGGEITAQKVGSTKLTTTFLGQTAQVSVTVAKDLSVCNITLGTTSYTYDGSAKKPTVTVKDGSTVLKKDTDYIIAYSNNKNIGTATATVTGKGNYTGSLSKTFKITVSKGASYTVDDLVYMITSAKTNGKGTVTGTGPASKKLTSAAIPATVTIGGVKFKVTKIAAKAFDGCTKLKTVTIGKNVTTIGNQAFSGCKKMSKVTIKAGTTTIGKKAFYNCKKLETITIKSKKLTNVGKNAFKGINSKATIKVPKSKLKAYKKLLKGKGFGKKVTITS